MWDSIECLEGNDVWKYIFKGKAIAEAVLYRHRTFEERTVICCSTQSGCPVGCTFCGTGNNFYRSLTAEEIVSQVVHLVIDKDIPVSEVSKFQIMFMSMGEPLLNMNQLSLACEALDSLYPGAQLLISTSAPRMNYDNLMILSKRFPQIGLQFSIHESSDEKRDRLIPFKKKLSLQEISEVGKRWAILSRRRPFFNYCVHPDNISDEEASALEKLFPPEIWECALSVICETDAKKISTDQRDLANQMAERMLARNFNVRIFDPAGQDDIGGGCGQLWQVQSWFKNRK